MTKEQKAPSTVFPKDALNSVLGKTTAPEPSTIDNDPIEIPEDPGMDMNTPPVNDGKQPPIPHQQVSDEAFEDMADSFMDRKTKELKGEEPDPEPIEEKEVPEEPGFEQTEEPEEEEVVESPNLSKQDNIKNLKQIANDAHAQRREAQQELEAARKKITDLEAQTVDSQEVEAMKEELLRLRQVEMRVDVENSAYAQETFKKPMNELVTRAQEIATDYGVDVEAVEGFFEAGMNNKELNEKLAYEFGTDLLPISDIKSLIVEHRKINSKFEESKKIPEIAQKEFKKREHAEKLRREQENQRVVNELFSHGFQHSVKEKVRNIPDLYEIQSIPGNDNHNKKVFTPMMKDVHGYYQYLTQKILDCGGTPDAELMAALGDAALSKVALPTVASSRRSVIDMFNEADQKNKKGKSISRPGLNTGARNSKSGKAKKGSKGDIKDQTRDISASIMSEVVSELRNK